MTVVDPTAISQATMTKMKLNNLEVARQNIMVTDDLTVISNNPGGIIGTHRNRKYSICIHGGFRLEVKSRFQLLGIYPMMHYILHVEMTLTSYIKILAHVMGMKNDTNNKEVIAILPEKDDKQIQEAKNYSSLTLFDNIGRLCGLKINFMSSRLYYITIHTYHSHFLTYC